MDDNLVVSGRVIQVLPAQSGESKKNPGTKWMKQEYVIETRATYPRQVCFQIFGEDRIKQANIQLGEDISVQIEINSREYNGRWYTNIDARNVMRLGAMPQQGVGYNPPSYAAPQTTNPYGQPAQGGVQPAPNMGGSDVDELPF